MSRLLQTAPARRLLLLAGVLALALTVGACGNKQSHPTTADTEGQYVDAGPLTYQVQLSRQLNPYDVEDRHYLVGVSSIKLKPSEEWFAVFLWSKNETKHPATTANRFAIVDTSGNRYYPVAINSSVNPFAWTPQTLLPLGTEPAPNSPASFSPTQGSVLLFKLNSSINSNRPLTLEIYAPGATSPSTISLDL